MAAIKIAAIDSLLEKLKEFNGETEDELRSKLRSAVQVKSLHDFQPFVKSLRGFSLPFIFLTLVFYIVRRSRLSL